MGSSQPRNVLSDSKSKKQRSVVITHENAVVYRDVGARSMMLKLHANHILSGKFQSQKGCYVSLLPVCFFTSNTVDVMLGICNVI
jgi:hypothetical protein